MISARRAEWLHVRTLPKNPGFEHGATKLRIADKAAAVFWKQFATKNGLAYLTDRPTSRSRERALTGLQPRTRLRMEINRAVPRTKNYWEGEREGEYPRGSPEGLRE